MFLRVANSMTFTWAIFVAVTIAIQTSANAEDTTIASNPNINKTSDVSRPHTFHKYIILYKDVANEQNVIDCAPPVNITLSDEDKMALMQWTSPHGVPLVTSIANNGMAKPTQQVGNVLGQGMTWVELTSSKTLVFHNPDDSVAGRYVCHSKSTNEMAYQVNVWVHVTEKNVFDFVERLKVAFITTAIFVGCILIIYGAYRWHRRNRVQYAIAKTYDDQNINIPTIQILSDDKNNYKIQA